MDEKILEKLEQDKFKSQKQAVLALKKDFESHHITTPEKKQEYVNDIYRSLSDTGAANFDKVINEYNKELNVDDQIKTYQDSIKQYNTEISRIAALFIEYGTEYQSNAEIDFFLKEQFASIADRVETGCIQDIIDAANLKLTQEMRRNKCSVEETKKTAECFFGIVKDYGNRNLMRLRASNIEYAKTKADILLDNLKLNGEDIDNLSKEQLELKKAGAINKFQSAILEAAKDIEPNNFQAVLNIVEKQLSVDERKALDDAIRMNNKYNENKFETRNIRLTERQKDSSWQKFELNGFLSKKLRELQHGLADVINHRERPKDKYDRGVINSALRAVINLQNIIIESSKCIGDLIDYYTAEGKEHEDKDSNKEMPTRNSAKEPFLDVMKEAYKTKGLELASLVNHGLIDNKAALETFIMDISYIKSIDDKNIQEEMMNLYSNSLIEALKGPEMTFECKNMMMTFIVDYQNGKFDDIINDNIENENFGWDKMKIHANINKEEKKDELKIEQKEESLEEINQKAKFNISKSGTLLEQICQIGENIAKKDDLNADEKMTELLKAIGTFSYEHPDLTTEEENEYTRTAAAVILTNAYSKELAANLAQLNTPKINIQKEEDRIFILMDAAAKIDMAGVKDRNVAQLELQKAMENAISRRSDTENKKKFVEYLANKTKMPKQQYFLALSAKSLSLKAEANKRIGSQEQARKVIDTLADKYKRSITSNQNIDTRQAFFTTCEMMPSAFSPDYIYDEIKEALKNNPSAINKLDNDAEFYNEINKQYDMQVIDFHHGTSQQSLECEEETKDILQEGIADILSQKEKPEQDIVQYKIEDIAPQASLEYEIDEDADIFKSESAKQEITVDMLVEAFDKGRNERELFANFIEGKSKQEIQNAVNEVDKRLTTQSGSIMLVNSLDENGLYDVSAKFSEKIYNEMEFKEY